MDDLRGYLEREGIWHRFIDKKETIHTRDAAEATGIELYRISKNLVCQTSEGEYVLLIIPGDKRVDMKAVAEILKTPKVSLIPFNRAEAVTGYPPGGTPSIGHRVKMRSILDSSFLKFETFYCGGGSRDRLLELKTDDVMRRAKAEVGDICSAS
jgi:Cys-tRNA(Pro)/Cys-tRNA(Cys) deacylase